MFGITGSPQCRHSTMNAILLQGNDIHVAFDHQPLLGFLLTALIQAIQQLVLMENFRIRRVDIFRLDFIIERTATKADHATFRIPNRENHPVTKQVEITTIVAGTNQT